MNKTNLLKISNIFRRLNIPFALAGGYAVAAWGKVRATRDIDLLASAPGDLAAKLVKEMKKAGFEVDYRKGDESDPLRGVICLEQAAMPAAEPVEIVLGIRDMPPCLFNRVREITFLGLEIPVVAPEDLIVLKCLAGGPVDLEDARSILKIMMNKLDMEYLKSEFKRCRLSLEKLAK